MIDGVVGKVLVSPRSVGRRGEPMIEIAGASLPGKIAKVSVIADALPKEFQKAFAPIDGTRWLESQRDHIGESSPAVAGSALASISPPDTGLYRRNASGRQSGIGRMLCLLECSIVCGSPGNLPLMKILVVDDHALIREALHGVLRKLTRDAVILEASDCAQTMEAV